MIIHLADCNCNCRVLVDLIFARSIETLLQPGSTTTTTTLESSRLTEEEPSKEFVFHFVLCCPIYLHHYRISDVRACMMAEKNKKPIKPVQTYLSSSLAVTQIRRIER
jgi:hypothetical protein